MLEVNVKEARSQLSSLLDRVERGEEIIINRRGKKKSSPSSISGKKEYITQFKGFSCIYIVYQINPFLIHPARPRRPPPP